VPVFCGEIYQPALPVCSREKLNTKQRRNKLKENGLTAKYAKYAKGNTVFIFVYLAYFAAKKARSENA